MGILGEEGLLGEGHFWTYGVTKIEVTSSVRDWNVLVDVTGIEPLTMDRNLSRRFFTILLSTGRYSVETYGLALRCGDGHYGLITTAESAMHP